MRRRSPTARGGVAGLLGVASLLIGCGASRPAGPGEAPPVTLVAATSVTDPIGSVPQTTRLATNTDEDDYDEDERDEDERDEDEYDEDEYDEDEYDDDERDEVGGSCRRRSARSSSCRTGVSRVIELH